MNITKEELFSGNIWMWGCTYTAKVALGILQNEGCKILGFFDNNPMLHGTHFHNCVVYDFSENYMKVKKDDIILCCCTSHNNSIIKKQIAGFGSFTVRELDIGVLRGKQTLMNKSFLEEGYESANVSRMCTQLDFEQEWFQGAIKALHRHERILTRKDWEFAFIIKILEDKELLHEGTSGLGFAVGAEPLPCFFASKGVEIVATDLVEDDNAKEWAKTGQNLAGQWDRLYRSEICSKTLFDEKVSFRNLDMNHIPADIGEYDFCWSACAIEHVGSLELSKQFIKNMVTVLKPGGVAIHTTEFNLYSNTETLEDGMSIIYRRKDLEEIQEWCEQNGHKMELSFKRTRMEGDEYVDVSPDISLDCKYHLNLMIGPFASTSFGIVIQKSEK